MKFLIAFAAASLAAAAANAQTYDFSYLYEDTGNTFSGELTGYIAGDTFHFTGLNWFKLNGVTVADATVFDSVDDFYGFAPGTPSAKLDNSYLDFLIANTGSTSAYDATSVVIFAVGDVTAAVIGTDLVGATTDWGGSGGYAAFNPADYSATITAGGAVPEPASWALMLSGFGLVGGAMRRRSVRFA